MPRALSGFMSAGVSVMYKWLARASEGTMDHTVSSTRRLSLGGAPEAYESVCRNSRKKGGGLVRGRPRHLLICTTFAGGKPLKYVDEAWEYAPIFSE